MLDNISKIVPSDLRLVFDFLTKRIALAGMPTYMPMFRIIKMIPYPKTSISEVMST